jgi:hypothetical protein
MIIITVTIMMHHTNMSVKCDYSKMAAGNRTKKPPVNYTSLLKSQSLTNLHSISLAHVKNDPSFGHGSK